MLAFLLSFQTCTSLVDDVACLNCEPLGRTFRICWSLLAVVPGPAAPPWAGPEPDWIDRFMDKILQREYDAAREVLRVAVAQGAGKNVAEQYGKVLEESSATPNNTSGPGLWVFSAARRPLIPGDEVQMCYVPSVVGKPVEERQRRMKRFGFECRCRCCTTDLMLKAEGDIVIERRKR